MQEVSQEHWIDIPKEILDIYRLWRPSPLQHAHRLEKALGTPAHIYYKYEGVSPAGSPKSNTVIAQAYYNKTEGVKRLASVNGAGQWGSALAMACKFFDLECSVYMAEISYDQKPYQSAFMETFGAEVTASPSDKTNAGRGILEKDPDSPGSLGMAISEAVEDAATHDDTRYSLGSVLNHVLMHQTIVGLESKKQMEMAGEYLDVVIGCVGGGSNMAGLTFPFMADELGGDRPDLRAMAIEPTACPTLTKGQYAYDFGDTAGMAPLVKMHTLGHTFVPPSIHAGGLCYHGDAPLLCLRHHKGLIEAVAYPQNPVFEAAITVAGAEVIIPAPESAHDVKGAIDEALRAKETGEETVILFGLSRQVGDRSDRIRTAVQAIMNSGAELPWRSADASRPSASYSKSVASSISRPSNCVSFSSEASGSISFGSPAPRSRTPITTQRYGASLLGGAGHRLSLAREQLDDEKSDHQQHHEGQRQDIQIVVDGRLDRLAENRDQQPH